MKMLIILLLLLAIVTTPAKAQNERILSTKKLLSSDIKAIIDSLDNSLGRYYVFPNKAMKMGAYLKSQLKSGKYKNIDSPELLAAQLNADLQTVQKDGHLHFIYNPSLEKDMQRAQVDPELIKHMQEKELQTNFDNNFFLKKLEVLPGNLGYLKLDGFSSFVEESKSTISAAIGFLKNTKAIIIDLRDNGGGSPEMVGFIESFFFLKRTRMNDIINRIENDTTEIYADPENTNRLVFDGLVYILVSNRTFSAAEDFSYGMQAAKRAIIVGETTGGGAHPMRTFSIGNGFLAQIPFGRSFNHITKTDWEGTGVEPDIVCPANEAIRKAQCLVISDLINKTEDKSKKAALQLQLADVLESPGLHVDTLNKNLMQYTGVFQGGLEFYVKDKKLYCRNRERGNEIFELKTITEGVFVLDENVNIKFIKSSEAGFSKLLMIWKDGNITQKQKVGFWKD